jgi:uncharacterized membrane protein
MGEGSDSASEDEFAKQTRLGRAIASSEELAALSARVTALELQLAKLSGTAVAASVESIAPPPLEVLEVPVVLGNTAPPPVRSLEDRLGSQIFSRVGIVALLIGATWFLKLAIDSQWIGVTARVLAGLLAGAGLVVWSERFRRKGFPAFSYTLKAVGSGVLYLSLWAAFQLYHLLPAGVALVAMLLITVWNAYMAWAQDAEVLAAYALVGGCATPLLLSTGGNHETFLFTYLLAIDVAAVVLVRLKPWPRLLLGVFPATVAYFMGWYSRYYSAEQFSVTAVFVALFFLAFASVPLRLRARGEEEVAAPAWRSSVITEVLLPLANAAFGALASYSVLQDSGDHAALPWMVLVFAAIYLGLMRLPQSAAAAAVHLSLAIVFVTVAIPLKVSGSWITVSWLVEGAALLWVAARLASVPVSQDSSTEAYKVLRLLAVSALLLGFFSLMMDEFLSGWFGHRVGTAFFNRRFATALVGIVAFALAAWIALRAEATLVDAESTKRKHFWLQIGGGAIIAVNLIAVLAVVREIEQLWRHVEINADADLQQALAISAFLMAYGAGLLAVGFWKKTAFIRWQALLLIVYTIAKTFLYDMRNLSQGYRVASFMTLGALLLAVSFAYQKDWLSLKDAPRVEGKPEESR